MRARRPHSQVKAEANGPSGIHPCHPCDPWLTPGHGLPVTLRGVLHCSVHHVAHPGHAEGQAGGRGVRAIAARSAVRDLRPAGTARVLRQPAADGKHVSFDPRGGAGVFIQAGKPDQAGWRGSRVVVPVFSRHWFVNVKIAVNEPSAG